MTRLSGLLSLLGWLAACAAAAASQALEVSVDAEGRMRADGAPVAMAGVEVPPPQALCASVRGDWRCGRLAALALIERTRGGLHCEPVEAEAGVRCTATGEDLAVWMTAQGWARAAPDAAPELRRAENRARDAALGVWRSETDPGRWRVPAEGVGAGCDDCAARHQRVTRGRTQPDS